MQKLIEISKSLSDEATLPIGLLTGAGIIHGLLVAEAAYESIAKSSVRESAQGGGIFSGHDGSMYQHVLDNFEAQELGAEPRGVSVPLTHAVVAMGMLTADVPAMRVNPRQVVSWWVTEHKIEGAKFQGGGIGVSF